MMTLPALSENPSLRQKAAFELLRRRNARRNFLDFVQYTMPSFEYNWHHGLMTEYLNEFAHGRIKRLMIFAPPRHTKSELVSRRLPAFMFGINPDEMVMSLAYGSALSSKMNRDVQRIIDSPEYATLFPSTRLYGKNIRTVADGSYLRNSDIFEIVGHQGQYVNAGIGGSITGMGFTKGIIDDPVKSRAEANSMTYSQRNWDWYAGVFYTRQQEDASILITHTRWSPHDIAGRILEQMSMGGEEWTVLRLPAIADDDLHPDDPRKMGEALWESRYPLEFLNKVRANNEYEFLAQYQQTPPALSGGLFDTAGITVIDHEPECTEIVRFYDLAVTAKRSADYTAGVKMGITKDNMPVILDLYHVQKEMPDVEQGIIQNAQMDGKDVRIRLEAEKAGIVQLQYLLRRDELRAYTMDAKAPVGDKYTRAQPFATRVNNGHVLMVKAGWNRKLLDELAMFSGLGSIHDDIVDACSGAWDMLSNDSGGMTQDYMPDALQDWTGATW